MSKLTFHKMHGLGNDFIIIDQRVNDKKLSNLEIAALADRKTSIGCDQLILVNHSKIADCKIEIYNQDASRAEACGNATRCVSYLFKTKTIETAAGVLESEIISENEVKVSMPTPTFYDCKNYDELGDNLISSHYLSIGNPHLILIVKNIEEVDLLEIGKSANNDPFFKAGVNVSILQIIGDHHLRIKTYERGVGLTLACGSAACASLAASGKKWAIVSQEGGDLKIEWSENHKLYMTGPVCYVFKGEI